MPRNEAMAELPSIAVLCGGVGAAKFLRGLVQVVPPSSITAIVNIADDLVLHGLHISPDIDTVIYTLADEIDPVRGWGLRDETWQAMKAISRFGEGDWFSLGDRDLGTHLHRTQRLFEGASLTEVTQEIAAAWGVEVDIVPISDDPVSTRVTVADDTSEISFQEYFVGRRHDVDISGVRFEGIENASLTDVSASALATADIVIIAPSNPLVSIGPLLAMGECASILSNRTNVTIGISPIVGGSALKGPAARMLFELGHDVSAVGVTRIYEDVVDVMIIDDVDAPLASEVARTGSVPFVTDTIMVDAAAAAALGRATISASNLHTRRHPSEQP